MSTKIEGEPSYTTLTQLEKELKANASTVDSDLGGGDHGYLGLVLSDAKYALIPGTVPFVAPTYPSALTIPTTASDVEALLLCENHKEEIAKHRECSAVKKTLLKHIQKAVDHQYIVSFINDDTGLLDASIPDIMDHLFLNYGLICGEEITAMETQMLWLQTHGILG